MFPNCPQVIYQSGWQFNRIFRPPNRPPKDGRRPKDERLRVGDELGGQKILLNCHPVTQMELKLCVRASAATSPKGWTESQDTTQLVWTPRMRSTAEGWAMIHGISQFPSALMKGPN